MEFSIKLDFKLLILIFSISNVLALQSYDFIVVGGGTGGCAVAARLAEDGKSSVLLIESGDVPPPDNEIPAFAPRFVTDRNVTFVYPSFPQKKSAKRRQGVISSIGGRMLGGSSSLNYMWFNRGHPKDWDNWANITLDSSWSYQNMMKYFKRTETYAGDFPSDQHGYSGPITVTRPRYAPGLDYWLDAGRELGFPVADPNGPQQISFAPVEFSKKFGRRVSSYTGYIKPLLPHASNLHILVNTNVTKIMFNGKQAIGVKFHTTSAEVSQSFPNLEAYATKEIIVSAGNLNSPLILLRSGIGPRKHLEDCGIDLVQDLPVGRNFHDHVSLPIHMFINNISAVVDEVRELNNTDNWDYYNRVGDGPFSNTRGGTGQSFIASSVAKAENEGDWGDLHICMAHSNEPYLSAYISSESEAGESDSDVPMSAALFAVRPKSRGTMKLNPKDPNGLPILDVGYFSDPRDEQMMLDAIYMTLKIFEETKSYARLEPRIVVSEYAECEAETIVYRSKEFWQCYIRHASQAGLHSGGTCRMGRRHGDKDAVVDSRLKVIGISNLRVVDASIMPWQTNANTQAAVYAIAEKAADLIKNEWGLSLGNDRIGRGQRFGGGTGFGRRHKSRIYY